MGWKCLYCALILSALLLSAELLPAQDAPTVAVLGDYPRLQIEGNRAFTAKQIRDAVDQDAGHQRDLRVQTPLAEYQQHLASMIQAGYLMAGFPKAQVTTRFVETATDNPFEEASTALVVEIQEGRCYPAGMIGVQGARLIDVERLQNELQRVSGETEKPQQPTHPAGGHFPGAQIVYWEAGKPVSLTTFSIESFTSRVGVLLKAQGFNWAKFSIQLEPDEVTHTTTLKVNIEDEGPRATLGKIEVSGHQRNSAESIIECLDLREGSVLTTDLLAATNGKLTRTGRFLHTTVDVPDARPSPSGIVPLKIRVQECAGVPLLSESLSEEQEVLLKFGRWMEGWWQSGAAYRAVISNTPVDSLCNLLPVGVTGAIVDAEAVVIPDQGCYFTWSLKLPGQTEPLRNCRILIEPTQIDCLFPVEKCRVRFDNPLSKVDSKVRLAFGPQVRAVEPLNPDSKFSPSFTLNFDFNRKPGGSLLSFRTDVPPVALLCVPGRPDINCLLQGDELVIKTTGHELHIDRKTGELNSFRRFDEEGAPGELLIQKDTDARQRIHAAFEQEGRGFRKLTGKNASLLNAVAMVCNQVSCRSTNLFSNSDLNAIQWIDTTLNEVLESDRNSADVASGSIGYRRFMIPHGHSKPPQALGQLSDVGSALGWELLWSNSYFLSAGSPLWQMSSWTGFWVIDGKGEWLSAHDLQATGELGPVSHLLGALLLHPLNPKASFQLANKGWKNRNSNLYRRELESLVRDDCLVGRLLLHATRRLSQLTPDELNTLIRDCGLEKYSAVLPAIQRALTQTSDDQFEAEGESQNFPESSALDTPLPVAQRKLVNPSDDQLRRVTVNILNALWESVLRDQVHAGLAAIAQPLPQIPERAPANSLIQAAQQTAGQDTGNQAQIRTISATGSAVPGAASKRPKATSQPLLDALPPTNTAKESAVIDEQAVLATVDGQPILAAELMTNLKLSLTQSQLSFHDAFGPAFEKGVNREHVRNYIEQALPHFIERRIVAQAAKKSLTDAQFALIKAAAETAWTQELQKVMQRAQVDSPEELQLVIEASELKCDLDVYRTTIVESQISNQFASYWIETHYAPSREEMLAYYQAHHSKFREGGKVRWRQLVIAFDSHPTRNEARRVAESLVQQAQSGTNFEALIRASGDGPKAADGGLWDWTSQGSLASQQLDETLFALPVGQVSGIIETPTGLQFVQAIERRDGNLRPFEQSEKQVKQRMSLETSQQRLKAYLTELRQAAKVEVLFDSEKVDSVTIPME